MSGRCGECHREHEDEDLLSVRIGRTVYRLCRACRVLHERVEQATGGRASA